MYIFSILSVEDSRYRVSIDYREVLRFTYVVLLFQRVLIILVTVHSVMAKRRGIGPDMVEEILAVI